MEWIPVQVRDDLTTPFLKRFAWQPERSLRSRADSYQALSRKSRNHATGLFCTQSLFSWKETRFHIRVDSRLSN